MMKWKDFKNQASYGRERSRKVDYDHVRSSKTTNDRVRSRTVVCDHVRSSETTNDRVRSRTVQWDHERSSTITYGRLRYGYGSGTVRFGSGTVCERSRTVFYFICSISTVLHSYHVIYDIIDRIIFF